jgi:hypothetical protein
MCLGKKMKKYTADYLAKILEKIESVDAILAGIGAGMSTSAGFEYSGERFERYFFDFKEKYDIKDMYEGGFYPFSSLEEYWAWWARQIYYNRYDVEIGKPYRDLLKILKDKNYFVLTTNVDHQIQKAGFDKAKLFYTQGDYGLWQCSTPCHNKTYDNQEKVRMMIEMQKDMKIPSHLVPYCPVCKKPMTMNLRIEDTFVQDEGWEQAKERYSDFLEKYKYSKIMFLELGVGSNTPGIIKYPFMQMTIQNENAMYVTINKQNSYLPKAIKDRSVQIQGDIAEILNNFLSTYYQKTIL